MESQGKRKRPFDIQTLLGDVLPITEGDVVPPPLKKEKKYIAKHFWISNEGGAGGVIQLSASEHIKLIDRLKGLPGHYKRCELVARDIIEDFDNMTTTKARAKACPLCGVRMNQHSKGEIMDHIFSNQHLNYKRLACDNCGGLFSSNKNYNRHRCQRIVKKLE